MGLAAGQARLLTITGRKSDCEFESMRLSHQKIALARELADLSNQYQDSLDYTKLVYDYYGTGDTNTQLSYGIMMSPSILNDYMPILATDSMGRAVLDSKYAGAARSAGIPQEGLGTLPSETIRNAFIEALQGEGIITPYMADTILSIPYNQGIGVGGGEIVTVVTEEGPFEEFCKHLKEIGDVISITTPNQHNAVAPSDQEPAIQFWYKNDTLGGERGEGNPNYCEREGDTFTFSLADLLQGHTGTGATAAFYIHNQKTQEVDQNLFNATQACVEDVINQIGTIFEDCLCLGDDYTEKAMTWATQQVKNLYVPLSDDGFNYSRDAINYSVQDNNYFEYVGWAGTSEDSSTWEHSGNWNKVDIGNIAIAYLTYFADFINGVSETDCYNNQILEAKKGFRYECKLADSYPDNTIDYVWKTGVEVSSDDSGQAQFYDALFNQLCLNGWVENDNVKDNDYLQKMLENGMMYITRVKDDGYYYQGNYATDTYINVVADERRIAAAEAKYNTEKAKLNAKEQTIDMKMKNLDTEISSLKTEDDTIKNT
ncbi:hypothetical protein J6P92_01945, partial [bacterium]|nr:hypothetical protein [bacterium]